MIPVKKTVKIYLNSKINEKNDKTKQIKQQQNFQNKIITIELLLQLFNI